MKKMPGLVHFLDEEKPSRLLQSRLVVNVIKLFVKKSRKSRFPLKLKQQ